VITRDLSYSWRWIWRFGYPLQECNAVSSARSLPSFL